jgi:BirA family transcriptional regulator, biotin operon repressor / biotin---[acetyl-CoA-carboxylase] ligase
MSHPYAQLDRPPLSERALQRALIRPGGLWSALTVVAETGSTNADLLAAAEETATGTVLIAESQTAGRGRLDRSWVSPPQAGLTFSMLLRPEPVRTRWSWLPLLVGVGLAEAVGTYCEIETRLKWPNDLLIDGRKAAGILAQVADDAVVVGIGLNVLTRRGELPEGATSLAAEGAARTDRDPLLRAILRAIETRYNDWMAARDDGDLRAAYRDRCATLDEEVTVTLPTGVPYRGRATDIDSAGRLLVGDRAFAVGDVTHVRPA